MTFAPMPYEWSTTDAANGPQVDLHLWPHRSLPRTGFVWVIGLTAGALALPMLAVLGTKVLWGLLPFAAIVVWALWFAIERSYRSGSTHEHLSLSRETLTVIRQDPGRRDRIWQTNPYWARANLRGNGPVEDYLTLTDGNREIELGAFLSPEERQTLRIELTRAFASMRSSLST